MTFLSPFWLWLIVPWGGLAVWLLANRPPDASVPFLALWDRDAPRRAFRRQPIAPPLAIAMLLAGLLSGIVAASGPAVRTPGAVQVDVILDAGNSMSGPAGSSTRLVVAAEAADRALRQLKLGPAVQVVGAAPSGGEQVRSIGALVAVARGMRPTATDTAAPLLSAVRQTLRESDRPIVVVSDRVSEVTDPRVVPFTPPAIGANLGITLLAATDSPKSQVMVRLHARGQQALSDVRVEVRSGEQTADRRVSPPADGQDVNLFVELPALTDVVSARILAPADAYPPDAYLADDYSTALREREWPQVEAAVESAALQKLVRIYGASRPHGEHSPNVRLVSGEQTLGASAGVIVPPVQAKTRMTHAVRWVSQTPAEKRMSGLEELRLLDLWSTGVPAAVDRALPAPANAWQVIASDDAGPLLATRPVPSDVSPGEVTPAEEKGPPGSGRQVWCAVSPEGWATTDRYVVFFASLIDWAANNGGSRQFSKSTWLQGPMRDRPTGWQPIKDNAPDVLDAGIYADPDSGRRAAFVADPLPASLVSIPFEDSLRRLRDAQASTAAYRSCSPGFAVAALACVAVATAIWPGARRRVDRTS